MNQNFLEKISIKLIALMLIILMTVALICSFKTIPHIIILSQNTLYIIILEIIGVVFLGVVLRILYIWIKNLNPKYYVFLSAICLLIITLGQLLVVTYLEIRPIEDLNKVTNMAIDLVNGKNFSYENTYFSRYTNNIPFTIYLSKYYQLCFKLGIRNYTLAGSLLGIFAINTSIIFTSLIVKELKNKTSAVFFLAFNVINPLIYLWVTFFYTTIIAIPFMMLAIYLLIKLSKETSLLYFCIEILLLTFSIYIGSQIRATTCFVLIGAFILLLLKLPDRTGKLKKMLTRQTIMKCFYGILLSLFCILILSTLYNRMLNSCMQADYSETKFPPTHWIMMGLKGHGGFNGEDEQETLMRHTEQEKVAFHKSEISVRLKQLGLKGIVKLVIDKLDYTWSDGTHDYPVMMRACHNYTNIHKYILGSKRDAVILVFQIFHIMTLILLIAKMIIVLFSKTPAKSSLLYIILFGGVLFHLIWEANPKYSLNFMMLLLLIDTEALDDIFNSEALSKKWDAVTYRICGCFILLTITISFFMQPLYTKQITTFNDSIQGQLVSNKDRIDDIYGNSFFYQTFFTNRAFNHMLLLVYNDSNYLDASYKAEIIDENDNLLYSTYFSPNTQNQLEAIEFDFPEIIPKHIGTYYIKITANSVLPEHAISFCIANHEGYDVFPYGNLSIDNQNLGADLTFAITNKTEGTYTDVFSYVKLIGMILLLEFIIYYYSKKRALKR